VVDESAEKLKSLRAKTRTSAQAATLDSRDKFEQATGKKWDAGKRVGGVPTTAGSAAHESAVAKGRTKAKKAA
jgi:hypothetical protein